MARHAVELTGVNTANLEVLSNEELRLLSYEPGKTEG